MRRTALILALLASALLAAPARAQTDLPVEIPRLLDEVTAAWVERQQADGRFVDSLIARPSGTYGMPMIGYAQVRAAERTGDPATREAGTLALGGSLRYWQPNAFELWATATALRRAGDLEAGLRGVLETEVAAFEELRAPPAAAGCVARRSCYSNLKLLDALTRLAASNTGVRDRRGLRAARRMVERRVPRVVDAGLTSSSSTLGSLRGSVLSDPVRNPLAYLAFSGWMMVRALDEIGKDADPRAEAVTRDVLDAMVALAAPDGDLTYLGRGQAQVWVPAVMVAAGVEGARRFGANPVRAQRYLGLAELGWERLQAYRTGGVLRLVPGERSDMTGVDDSAGEVTYNGMALFALQHALDALEAGLPSVAQFAPPAVAGDMHTLDGVATGLAVVRRREVWFAVHERMTHPVDLRSDFGLLALKWRGREGWRDLLSPRPLTLDEGDARYTAGPVLLRGGRVGYPHGKRLSISRAGVVTVRGEWRTESAEVIRRGVIARYEPLYEGVTVVVPARRGDRFRTAVFAPTGTWYPLDLGTLRTANATIEVTGVARRGVDLGFHSASERDLERIELETSPSRGEPLKIVIRAS